MERVKNIIELEKLRNSIQSKEKDEKSIISICAGTGCRATGSEIVIDAFKKEIKFLGLQDKVVVKVTGCHGFCETGPIVVIHPENIFYKNVEKEDIIEIVSETIIGGKIIDRLLYVDPKTGKKIVKESDIPFYSKQERIILGVNGKIDPTNIDDYIAIDGYSALAKALFNMKPEKVIDKIKKSGLRGRGGGGFPTGKKWEYCSQAGGDTKYVICNADEGDPGAYMDRSLLEGNPHSVVEGMIIGAYAIGANQGYVYVRHEYPLAVKHLEIAIKQAEKYGFLGKNILNSGFDFTIKVSRGGGAFVCGESTALMASLEGKPGEPRSKYIHTVEKGLWNNPTTLNNVETWANIPLIIKKGANWFSNIGTETSKGTKIFSLVGNINNTGLVEVPMGMKLREIVHDIGGGTGAYACWLLEKGYSVTFVDLVPKHVEMANKKMSKIANPEKFSTIVGDACGLDFTDNSTDIVLLMRPLYHLQEKNERLSALNEAFRILKPGGHLFCTIISKFASLLDGLDSGYIHDSDFRIIIKGDLECSCHNNHTKKQEYFTTAYFQHPDELNEEMITTGFTKIKTIGIEGLLWASKDLKALRQDAEVWKTATDFMRIVESDKSIIGTSPHIMGMGIKPNSI